LLLKGIEEMNTQRSWDVYIAIPTVGFSEVNPYGSASMRP